MFIVFLSLDSTFIVLYLWKYDLSIHVSDAILPPPGQWARLHQELQQLFERVAGLLIKKSQSFVLFCFVIWNHWTCVGQLITSNVEITHLTNGSQCLWLGSAKNNLQFPFIGSKEAFWWVQVFRHLTNALEMCRCLDVGAQLMELLVTCIPSCSGKSSSLWACKCVCWRSAPPYTHLEGEWLKHLPQAPDRQGWGFSLDTYLTSGALYILTRSLNYSHFLEQKRNSESK